MRQERCGECGGRAFVAEDHYGPARCDRCAGVVFSALVRLVPAPIADPEGSGYEPSLRFQVGSDDSALRRAGVWVMLGGKLALVLGVGPAFVSGVFVVEWIAASLGPLAAPLFPGGPFSAYRFAAVCVLWFFILTYPAILLLLEGRRWRDGKLTRHGRVTALFAFHLAAILAITWTGLALSLRSVVFHGWLSPLAAQIIGVAYALVVLPAVLACLWAGFAAWGVLQRPAAREAWKVLPKPPLTWD